MPKKFSISLERSGGFTGIPFSYSVDSSRLSQSDLIEFDEILERVSFNAIQDSVSSMPDTFNYKFELKIESDKFSFLFNDKTMPEQFKKLAQLIIKQSRSVS